jgi:hypothetical protein
MLALMPTVVRTAIGSWGRVQTVNRLHALLAEPLPGQAKKDITAGQVKTMVASVRARDVPERPAAPWWARSSSR